MTNTISENEYWAIASLGDAKLTARAFAKMPQWLARKCCDQMVKRAASWVENQVIKAIIAGRRRPYISNAEEFAIRFPEQERTTCLVRCVDILLEEALYVAHEIVVILPEPERTQYLESILQRRIKEGDVPEACMLVKLLGRALVGEELDTLLNLQIHSGELEFARTVSALMGRDLTRAELMTICKYHVRTHFVECSNETESKIRLFANLALAD